MTRQQQITHKSTSRAGRKAMAAACTIISRNYLSYARILAQSFRQHHPDGRFYVLVIDGVPAGVKFDGDVAVIGPEVLELPYVFELCLKYDVTELATAVKPSLLLALLRHYSEQEVIYFDPDILITRQLSELFAAMNRSNVVLTPHLLSPIPVDGLRPSEQDILRAGAYNLGFIAVRESREVERFLEWWQERLQDFSRIDLANGLFTDQKWIDLVPGLVPDVSILNDETYNVAYWNLHSRSLARDNDRFLVNGRPLAFFHFSGFDPRRPGVFSRHQTRTAVTEGSPLARLLTLYSQLHFDNGFEESMGWEYGYSRFLNGVRIHEILRRLYLRLDARARLRFGNPFETQKPDSFFTWATSPSADCDNLSPFLHEIYRLRYEVASAFPDVRAADREGFLTWARSCGVREMGYDPALVSAAALERAPTGGSRIVSGHSDGSSRTGEPCLIDNLCATDAGAVTFERNGGSDYQLLIARIRGIVESCTQPAAVIAVASKGDDALLAFRDRTGCHFPQTSDGEFAGYFPADSGQAIAHLESLRKRGTDYLLFPATSAWWLHHYSEFRQHLESRYRRLDVDGNQSVIFDLRKPREDYDRAMPLECTGKGPPERGYGVNVSGYISSEKGVGEGVRSDLRSLAAAGIPFALNDWLDCGSENVDTAYTSFSGENPHSVNLVHINADQAPAFARAKGPRYFLGHYNIGYWAWELSDFPEKWKGSFEYFDEIWVPSNFVLDAVARVAPIPVLRIPHSIPEPLPTIAATRSTFGIPEDKFAFLFIFDCHSFLARKNPFGLIEAYRKASRPGDDTMLVLKSSHASPEHLRRLREASSGADVLILNGVLSREETNTLLALCDCYVSLHRSEGFGLTLAEAMSVAKPVIATAYSGNMDFMTVGNSFPVKYSLAEITENYGPYRTGNVWADPDLDHAAELMRHVFNNPDVASTAGRQARRDVVDRLHPRVVGEMMRSRLAHIADLCRRDDSSVRARAITTASPGGDSDSYEQMVLCIRQLVENVLPADATVLVVSRGDDHLLQLGRRRAWHFPQDVAGQYAGHHPRNSGEAVALLGELRAKGAQYLLFPGTALWWLEHYVALREHLESRHRRIAAGGPCVIYELTPGRCEFTGGPQFA
jgi:glycosyltransferase involved in cell wall biosynthesis